jgi:PEP-CTERM motif-containing protein
MRKTWRWRLLLMAGLVALAPAAHAAIIWDVSVGTGPRPALLGGFTMTDYCTVCGGLPIPAPGGGFLDLSSPAGVAPLVLGSSWASWNPGLSVGDDIYYSGGSTELTLTLPAGRDAFYFYAEPNPFGVFDITATTATGEFVTIPIDGASGASFFGVYTTAGETLTSIVVSSTVDFAVAEFGEHVQAAPTIPEPSSIALLALGGLALVVLRRRR